MPAPIITQHSSSRIRLGFQLFYLHTLRVPVLCMQMREGSDTFSVHAYLPVEAAFGLADELRRWGLCLLFH